MPDAEPDEESWDEFFSGAEAGMADVQDALADLVNNTTDVEIHTSCIDDTNGLFGPVPVVADNVGDKRKPCAEPDGSPVKAQRTSTLGEMMCGLVSTFTSGLCEPLPLPQKAARVGFDFAAAMEKAQKATDAAKADAAKAREVLASRSLAVSPAGSPLKKAVPGDPSTCRRRSILKDGIDPVGTKCTCGGCAEWLRNR